MDEKFFDNDVIERGLSKMLPESIVDPEEKVRRMLE